MPTHLPDSWSVAARKESVCRLHPLAIGGIVLLAILHLAGGIILESLQQNVVPASLEDASPCAIQSKLPAPALPYD